MVMNRQKGNPLQNLTALMARQDLCAMQTVVENTYIGEMVVGYAVALVNATRNHPMVQRGASPRATLAVVALAKALAQLRGRDYVLPEDVQESFFRGIGHRLLLSAAAHTQNCTAEQVLQQILSTVPAPRLR